MTIQTRDLGDDVSAEYYDDGDLLLETSEHVIVLSPAVYAALVAFMAEQLTQPGGDVAQARR